VEQLDQLEKKLLKMNKEEEKFADHLETHRQASQLVLLKKIYEREEQD
jgi:hypothetical protein